MPLYSALIKLRSTASSGSVSSFLLTACRAVANDGGVVRDIRHHGVRFLPFKVRKKTGGEKGPQDFARLLSMSFFGPPSSVERMQKVFKGSDILLRGDLRRADETLPFLKSGSSAYAQVADAPLDLASGTQGSAKQPRRVRDAFMRKDGTISPTATLEDVSQKQEDVRSAMREASKALRSKVSDQIVDDLMEELMGKQPQVAAGIRTRMPEFEDNFERLRVEGLMKSEHVSFWEENASDAERERIALRMDLHRMARKYQQLALRKVLVESTGVDQTGEDVMSSPDLLELDESMNAAKNALAGMEKDGALNVTRYDKLE